VPTRQEGTFSALLTCWTLPFVLLCGSASCSSRLTLWKTFGSFCFAWFDSSRFALPAFVEIFIRPIKFLLGFYILLIYRYSFYYNQNLIEPSVGLHTTVTLQLSPLNNQ